MKRAATLLVILLVSLPLLAQTMYYNHPKGVLLNPAGTNPFVPTLVAKLTLPAGIYHVVFKSGFDDTSGNLLDVAGVTCVMLVTGIPNVTSPYLTDSGEISLVTATDGYSHKRGVMVLETGFYTNGGTVRVSCETGAYGFKIYSEYINLTATKLGTLMKQ